MEDEVLYELWVEFIGLKQPRSGGYISPMIPQKNAEEYNAEERELASMENRPVRKRFFVVRVTRTYEEV